MTVQDTGARLTARLELRPIGPEHVAELVALHSEPMIAQWFGGRWEGARAVEYARTARERWERDLIGTWMAYDRRSGRLVGRGGASRTTLLGGDDVEIGWVVREGHQGRGYATEIGRAALRHVAETADVRVVHAFTEVHNLRSRAVMERLGMSWAREVRLPGLVEGTAGIQPQAQFAVYTCAPG